MFATESYSEWINSNCVPAAERMNLLRELMSYAMLCPHSSSFGVNDELTWASPLHWSRRFEWPWVLHNAPWDIWRKVLDVGGCWSVLGQALAKRSGSVQVLDYEQEYVDRCQESINRAGLSNMRSVRGDARELPYHNNSFNLVTCVSVLEHIPDKHEVCIEEMLRVLRPRGMALITMDIKLSGERKDNSYLSYGDVVSLVENLGLPMPHNQITLHSIIPDDNRNPLVFTVLFAKLVKK